MINYMVISNRGYKKVLERERGLPVGVLMEFNCIIVVDYDTDTFFYFKNRFHDESKRKYPLSILPNHIRRIHRDTGFPLTFVDELKIKTMVLIDKLRNYINTV